MSEPPVITVEPQDIPNIVREVYPVGIPIALIGSPGTAKTATIQLCAEVIAEITGNDLGWPMTVVENSTSDYIRKKDEYGLKMYNTTYLEPEDFVFPSVDTKAKKYERFVIEHLPRRPHSLVSFEEIAKKPDLFKIMAQLMNEGRLGLDYVVPDNTYFMCTSNLATDGAGAFDFHTDLINRMMILEVKPTAKGFCKRHEGELHDDIMGLLKWFPDLILTFSSSARKKAFASPRSIYQFNKMLLNGTDFIKHQDGERMMRGLVGEKFTQEYRAMIRAVGDIDIDAILSDPDGHRDEIQRLKNDRSHNGRQTICSILCHLSKRVKKDASAYDNIIKFMEMIDDEAAVTFTHMALKVNKDVEKRPEFGRHYARNQGFYF